ncbi:MAG TPA: hypothetical protein VFU82_03540, partial [Gammaproteobacteria bacterium]|nr:hypothetical protein [Gammaproteobacteria bacterium]
MKLLSYLKKSNIIAYAAIIVCVFAAISPVIYSNNYIRQDDLMWEIWPWMKPSDFGYLYYNTVFQLVRPICMLSFYLTDLLSIGIQGAVYVRFFSLVVLIILAIMLFRWQLYFNKNKLLATTFAICTFTLPAYQVFAATANYELILTSLVMTLFSGFLWYKANLTLNYKAWKSGLILGCLLFFASMLNYPLSSMFIWAMLVITYLNSIDQKTYFREHKLSFIAKTTCLTIALMVFYYLSSRAVHLLFHVRLDGSRVAVINTEHLLSRLNWLAEVLGWHSYFWRWNNTPPLYQTPFVFLLPIFTLAIFVTHFKNGYQSTLKAITKTLASLGILLTFFFLSYSPILATSEYIITYRYSLVTMPILLYLTLWSISVLLTPSCTNKSISNLFGFLRVSLYSIFILSGVYYANLRLADNIVGPHDNEFTYVQQQLNKNVIPLIQKNKKVLIHAIACDPNNTGLEGDATTSFEYGMNICQYQQQVIGVIIHSLYKDGIPSNFNDHNNVIYGENEITVKDTPWGTLLVNGPSNTKIDGKAYRAQGYEIVTLDTRNIPVYRKYSLYRKVMNRLSLS